MGTTRQFKWLALSLVWAVVIFTLSGDSCSAAASAGIINRVLRCLSIPFLLHGLELVNVILRKTAHLTEYGIFSVILYYAIKPADESIWSSRSAIRSIILSAAYSLTDEFHQIFVAGRHPSIVDCVID